MRKRREISIWGALVICGVVIMARKLLKIEEDKDSKNAKAHIPGL